MNIEHYPYAIVKIYKNIKKETSFLSKFYFLLDLYDAIIKYLYLISISCLDKEEISKISFLNTQKSIFQVTQDTIKDNNFFESTLEILKNLSKIEKLFISELRDFEKSTIWKDLSKLEKIKKTVLKKDIQTEIFYKKLYTQNIEKIETILKDLSFISNYEIILSLDIQDNFVKYISLGNNFKIQKSFVSQDEIQKEVFYIKKLVSKNTKLLELNADIFKDFSNIFYSNEVKSNNFEILINSLNVFLGGMYLRVKIDYEKEETKEVYQEENIIDNLDFTIERPYINKTIDKFLDDKKNGYFIFTGLQGSGRTTSLLLYQKTLKDKNFYITSVKKNGNLIDNFEDIYKQISKKHELKIEFGKDVKEQLNNFEKILNLIGEFENKEIIVFDDIDNLIDSWSFINSFPLKLPKNIYFILTTTLNSKLVLPNFLEKTVYYIPNLTAIEVKNIAEKLGLDPEKLEEERFEKLDDVNYGIPIYTKLMISKLLKENETSRKNLRHNLEKYFLDVISQLSKKFSNKNEVELINQFFGIFAISKEGYTKEELKQIFPELTSDMINEYLEASFSFLIQNNERYKFVSSMYNEICINLLKETTELKKIHNRIISFFEPWDKKIKSKTLKYLPYHYLQTERIVELKKLFESNFLKSKFKIYPQETLEDIKDLISYLVKKEPNNITDILKFSLIYQNLKDNTKYELLNINDLCRLKDYKNLLKRIETLNKPIDKFYQLLITADILLSKGKTIDAKKIIELIITSGKNVFIDQYDSELIYTLCADIANKGSIEIIDIINTKEKLIDFIKNIKETQYTYDVLVKLVKFIITLPLEIEKTQILESLITKISEFTDVDLVSKFFVKFIDLIEGIENTQLKDRLYYVYITNLLRQPNLYKRLVLIILEKRSNITNPLFRFLFLGNLSLIYHSTHQLDKSKEVIMQTLEFVNEEEFKPYINFMIATLILSSKQFVGIYYYEELVDKIFVLIEKYLTGEQKIEKTLALLNGLKDYKDEKIIIKSLLDDVLKLKDNSYFTIIRQYIQVLNNIKDGRTKNPIIKKILNVAKTQDDITKFNTYSALIFYGYSKENIFEEFKNSFSKIESNLPEYKHYFEIILDDIYFSKDKTYLKEIMNIVISKLHDVSENFLIPIALIIKILDIFEKEFLNIDYKKLLDEVHQIAEKIYSVADKLKISSYISLLLIKLGEQKPALNILHRVFSFIALQTDDNIYSIIFFMLRNIGSVKDDDYIHSLLVNIFNILKSFKNEDYVTKMIFSILENLPNSTKFPYLKYLFYKILEIIPTLNYGVNKDNIIKIIRFKLTKIKEKDVLLDILENSIIFSEKIFDKNNSKLLSLISSAFINNSVNNIENSENLFNFVSNELKTFSYEEYLYEVVKYFSLTSNKFEDDEKATELYKSLIKSEKGLKSSKFTSQVYSEIANNLIKLGNSSLIIPLFEDLLEKQFDIKDENSQVVYLSLLFSLISNIILVSKDTELIGKIFELSKSIKKEENLVSFFRVFIIAIDKLQIEEMFSYFNEIEKRIQLFTDNYLKGEILSIIATAYFKYQKFEMGIERFNFSIKLMYGINEVTKQIDYIGNISLRILLVNNFNLAKSLINFACQLFGDLENEEEKLKFAMSFVYKYTSLSSIKNAREFFKAKFEELASFKEENNLARYYIVLAKVFYKLDELDYAQEYFEKAEEVIKNLDDSTKNIELIIFFVVTLLQSKNIKGNEFFENLLNIIESQKEFEKSDLAIKLFNSLIQVGELQYDFNIYDRLLKILDEINLNSLNEDQLFNLAYTYAYKNKVDKFLEISSLIKNSMLREHLTRQVVSILKDREDIKSLKKLIPSSLNNFRTLDLVLSSILFYISDLEQIKKITEIIINN